MFLLDLLLWPEGFYELGSVRPSVLSYESFLGIGSLVFSETHHGVRHPCFVVRDRTGFFGENLFDPKMGKMGQKQGFSNLLESLIIIFFKIWSIKKVYNICCILAQIPYLGKIWFPRCGPKCSRPVRLQCF